jgi:hypothetical protein
MDESLSGYDENSFDDIINELGILASDSTSVETDRYDYEVKLVKSKRKFEKRRSVSEQSYTYSIPYWKAGNKYADLVIDTCTQMNHPNFGFLEHHTAQYKKGFLDGYTFDM